MLVEALSLVTALANAGSSVLISKGMETSDPYSANILSTSVQAGVLTLILLSDMPFLDYSAVALFALSGLLALSVARLLNFVSIDRIGVATSSAIIGSNPLMSTILAIAFLGEDVSASTFLGASMVVLGVLVISRVKGRFQWSGGVIIALVSAVSYALSNVIRKMGLNIQPIPVLGAQTSSIAGALGFLLYLASTKKISSMSVDRTCLTYFSSAGILSSVGWIALLRATELGKVSVVTTIVFSYPLFSILLTWLFLREEEITPRLVVGCLGIVLGVIIVSMY